MKRGLPVLPARKARSEIPVPKAPAWQVLLARRAMSVPLACKA